MERRCGPIYGASSRNQFKELMKAVLAGIIAGARYSAFTVAHVTVQQTVEDVAKRLLGRAGQV